MMSAEIAARGRADPTNPASALSDEQVEAIIERTRSSGLGVHEGMRVDGFTGVAGRWSTTAARCEPR